MRNLFDIKSGKIIINPTVLIIPQFKLIWERDQSEEKDIAIAEISYIVFMIDLKSPYTAYSFEDKEKMIKLDLFSDENWQPDDLVINAFKKYEELQETTNSRLLKSAKIGAEKLSKYFENYDPSAQSAKELASNLSVVGTIIKSLSMLEKQVEKEQVDDSKVRGQNEIGLYEM